MSQPIFITGIGTGVGKTIAAAIVTEALQAHYWKPVQAGMEEGTDALTVQKLISNKKSVIHPELYKLQLAASPHIAARDEGVVISIPQIVETCRQLNAENSSRYSTNNSLLYQTADFYKSEMFSPLIIEGAGGIMVPLQEHAFTGDLIAALDARVILVSRNYLGSINHSLLTAAYCRQKGLQVAGWLFNDQYLSYEQEIADWSGYPSLGSIPFTPCPDRLFVQQQAEQLRGSLQQCFLQ